MLRIRPVNAIYTLLDTTMSLYADYIRERENKHIVETDKGFATYTFTDLGCYIEDIYVKPEHREEGIASDLANSIKDIAKSKGCKYLFGSVVPGANGSTASLKVLLAYGFKLKSSSQNFIVMEKEI